MHRIQFGFKEQIRDSDDTVHGGANFMAYVGQELAFGLADHFSGFLGLLQLPLGLFAIGDIFHRSRIVGPFIRKDR